MHLLEKINNITIGARLIAGFVIVTILMSSVGVIGFVRNEFYRGPAWIRSIQTELSRFSR